MSARHNQRGFGLIEIVLVLVVVAVAGFLFMRYIGSTATTIEKLQEERPIAHARLMADQATLGTIRAQLRTYQAEHEGKWPADKAAVLALLPSAPKFQCAGNDFEYDAASGEIRLLITDAARC
jgi:prepilin-type N-terminal cleavage/methylation domain-containing protein